MSEEKIKEMEAKLQLMEAEKNKLEESLKLKDKEVIVEKILTINKELDKNVLMEKSEAELKIIESYESKIKEAEEEEDPEKEEPDKPAEEGAEVADDAAEGEPKAEGDAGLEEGTVEDNVEVNEKNGCIGMNKKLYKDFNKSLRESIYR